MIRFSLFLRKNLPAEMRNGLIVERAKKLNSSFLCSLATSDPEALSSLEKAGFEPQVKSTPFLARNEYTEPKLVAYAKYRMKKNENGEVLVHVPSFQVLSEIQQQFIKVREGKDVFLYRWNGDGSAVLRVTQKCLSEMHDTAFPFFEITEVQSMTDRAWILNEIKRAQSEGKYYDEEKLKELSSLMVFFRLQANPESKTAKTDFFEYYRHWNEIEIFISMMSSQLQADKQMTILPLGTSNEKNSIMAVKVNKSYPAGVSSRPAIVIISGQCGHHYSSVTSALYAMYEACFAKCYESVLEHFDIHFIPVVNVDGYSKSFRNENIHMCRYNSNGVDLSENWGVSTHSKTEVEPDLTFFSRPGPHPFSEVETRAVKDYIEGLDQIAGVLNVESYGMRVLRPSCIHDQIEDAKLNAIGEAMAKIMNQYHPAMTNRFHEFEAYWRPPFSSVRAPPSDMGGNYVSVSSSFFFKVGTEIDYLYNKYKIPCFTLQLPPAREIFKISTGGVTLDYRPPPELIIGIGHQFSKGLVEFASHEFRVT